MGDGSEITDFLNVSYFALKRCGAQPISFSTIQYYYSFWGARGACTWGIETIKVVKK